MGASLGLAAVVILTLALLVWRFRLAMARARAAVRGAPLVKTACGPVEYAEAGSGLALLSIHGSGGGWDQGLANAAAFVGDDFRIIAPSRFGYLATPAPADDGWEREADLHAALLDRLDIDQAVVLGASAGARSALDLAIRHPDKVLALVLVVPTTHAPADPVRIDPARASGLAFRIVKAGADPVWWAGMTLVPQALLRFLGVDPAAFQAAGPDERQRAMAMVRGILPLSLRVAGINRDSRPDRPDRDLTAVRAPTLIVAARDDLFNTLPAARLLAEAVPHAELCVLPRGGHLLVGQRAQAAGAVRDFLVRVCRAG